MAFVAGASFSVACLPRPLQRNETMTTLSSWKSVSFSAQRKTFPSVHLQTRLVRVSCAFPEQAKPETVEKVCEIVRKQLAISADQPVTGDSKFASLGADSLDTVEIVMGLEEKFGITVEEDSAQAIATVQDAADLIEDLVAKNA